MRCLSMSSFMCLKRIDNSDITCVLLIKGSTKSLLGPPSVELFLIAWAGGGREKGFLRLSLRT